jgi:tetratricopeptide (TPR) repeat protein
MDKRARPQQAPPVIHLYCCCHPKNEPYLNELEEHFAALKRQGQLEVWHSDKMLAGVVQEQEIDTHFSSADIILLFISHYFFNSNECWKIMEHALKLHHAGTAIVVPVLVSPVDYEATPIGILQELPRKKPLSRFTDRNEGYVEIVKEIRALMQKVQIRAKEIQEQTAIIVEQDTSNPSGDSTTSPSAASFVEKGDILVEQHQYDDAISMYNEAIRLDPNFAPAYKGKAQVLELLALLAYQKLEQLAVQSFEIEQPQTRTQEDLG